MTHFLYVLAGLKLPDVPHSSPQKDSKKDASQDAIFIPDISPSEKVKRSKEAV